MNYATHKISLDIHKPESQAVLHMKRTDTGRKIKISLTEDGRPYMLTPDCSAVFKAKKPDGHNITVDCAIDGNVIIYTVSFQTTASLGEVECEIMLYNESGMLVTSPRFVIIVNDTVQSEGSIAESDSEASIKFNELLKSKLKTAVEEHFEENPVKEISEEQEKNIEENTKARHSHKNKDIIDKLSEDNGTLTYNDKSIGSSGERPMATKTFSFDDAILVPDTSTISEVLTVISYDPIEDIPVGTEIKTIEFLYNGEWVDIHRMFELDDVPYVLNMNRAYYSEQYGVYVYAMVNFAGGNNSNTITDAVMGYEITQTRITYYTN